MRQNELVPYRKEPTQIVGGLQWYKIMDKNGMGVVNSEILEDKADFIVRACNSHDKLLAACCKLATLAYTKDKPDSLELPAWIWEHIWQDKEFQAVLKATS